MSEILNKIKKKLLGCREKGKSVEGDERHEARANKRNASPTRSNSSDVPSNRNNETNENKTSSFGFDKLKQNLNVDNIKAKATELSSKIKK